MALDWSWETVQKYGGYALSAVSTAWGAKKHRDANSLGLHDRVESLERSRRELERSRADLHRAYEGLEDRMNAVDIRQDKIERQEDDNAEMLRRIERQLARLMAEMIRRVPDPTTEARRPGEQPSR